MDLVKLLHTCIQYEVTQDQLDEIEVGFQTWVEDYERYVFLHINMCDC